MNVAPTQAHPKHLPVRPEWLALRTEAVIEPDLPIIDPHHHLWDHAGNRYLFPELVGDLGAGHNIRATVFIQCDAMYRKDGDPRHAIASARPSSSTASRP